MRAVKQGEGEEPATISGGTVSATLDDVGADITAPTLTLAVGTAPAVSETASVTVNATITSMTATDKSNGDNTVTVANGDSGDIYVAVGSSGTASVTFSTETSPATAADRVFVSGVGATWSAPFTTPVLTVKPPPGGTKAQWDYTVTSQIGTKVFETIIVHAFKLEITAVDGTPLSTTVPTPELVGKNVVLGYAITEGDTPPGYDPDPVLPVATWTIPGADDGTAVTDFAHGQLDGSSPKPLSPALLATDADFYWIAPSTGTETVSVQVDFGGQQYGASAPFVVAAPTYTFTGAPFGRPAVLGPRPQWQFYYGFSTSASVTSPTFAGRFEIVQNGTVDFKAADTLDDTISSTTNGDLTNEAIYGPRGVPGSGRASAVQSNRTDLHSIPLRGEGAYLPFTTASVSSGFIDYLMYEPAGGIWVTLATLGWGYTATATWNNAAFVLTSRSASTGPPLKSSAEPTWSGPLGGFSTVPITEAGA